MLAQDALDRGLGGQVCARDDVTGTLFPHVVGALARAHDGQPGPQRRERGGCFATHEGTRH
jgi:hypothetical protein